MKARNAGFGELDYTALQAAKTGIPSDSFGGRPGMQLVTEIGQRGRDILYSSFTNSNNGWGTTQIGRLPLYPNVAEFLSDPEWKILISQGYEFVGIEPGGIYRIDSNGNPGLREDLELDGRRYIYTMSNCYAFNNPKGQFVNSEGTLFRKRMPDNQDWMSFSESSKANELKQFWASTWSLGQAGENRNSAALLAEKNYNLASYDTEWDLLQSAKNQNNPFFIYLTAGGDQSNITYARRNQAIALTISDMKNDGIDLIERLRIVLESESQGKILRGDPFVGFDGLLGVFKNDIERLMDSVRGNLDYPIELFDSIPIMIWLLLAKSSPLAFLEVDTAKG